MGTVIKIPMRNRKPSAQGMDPFFKVEVLKYIREDGVYDGRKAIVNTVTDKTMGEVSEGYNVVTHKEASNVIKDVLKKLKVEFTSDGPEVGLGGALFYETIAFPSLAFNPASKTGVASTALDLTVGGHDHIDAEVLIPYIKVRNSYNKLTKIGFNYGVARPWCTNGCAIITSQTSLAFKHNQEFDLNAIKVALFDHLQANSSLMEKVYERLNQEKGADYLRDLIEGDFPSKFKLALLEKMNPFATIKSTKKMVEGDNHEILEIESINTKASGWAVYNMATDVSTHLIPSPVERDKIDRRIAKTFSVK
jgi:hypothetical protein